MGLHPNALRALRAVLLVSVPSAVSPTEVTGIVCSGRSVASIGIHGSFTAFGCNSTPKTPDRRTYGCRFHKLEDPSTA